jgi:hypothetical protein
MSAIGSFRRMPWLVACCLLCPLFLGTAQASARIPIALGVNIADAPDLAAPMTHYVDLVHRRPAIIMWYQEWSEPLFYSDQLPHVKALGAIPMITWDPMIGAKGISLLSIVRGRYDAYIRAAARAAAAWRRPMYIRLGHEMNLAGSPFGPGHRGDTAHSYVAAWRHVVRIFRRQGARNVEWVFSPNTDCAGKCPFNRYYPGNRWVDWVALDGYNYSTVDHTPWMSLAQVFGSSYRTLTRLSSKPVMIGETASAPTGGNKARWISRSFGMLPRHFKRVRAVVWFDRNKETNWTVNSSPSTLAAWRRVVSSPSYAGSASTLLNVVPLRRDVTTDPMAVATRTRRHARHRRSHA